MRFAKLEALPALALLAVVLASLTIAPVSTASTSVSTQTSVSIEQFRAEALLLKIMIERAISVYVLPPELEKQAKQLIRVNISVMTSSELEKYIANCVVLLNEIKSFGRPVNIENATSIAKSIAKEVAKRIMILSKVLNVTINATIFEKLARCRTFKEMKMVLAQIRAELTPLFIEREASKIMAIVKHALSRNVSSVSIEEMKKRLVDALKMLKILNRTIIAMNRSFVVPIHIKKRIEIVLLNIKSEAKELQKAMENLMKEMKKFRYIEHEVAKFKMVKKLNPEVIKKLMTELEIVMKKLEKAINYSGNTSVRMALIKMLEKLKADKEALSKVISGKVTVKHAISILKEVSIDIAKANTLVSMVLKVSVTVEHLKASAGNLYNNITVSIEHLVTLVHEMGLVAKELNVTKVVETTITITNELEKLAKQARECMEINNVSERLACLKNVSEAIKKLTIEISKNVSLVINTVITEISKEMTKIYRLQNVAKEINSYLNRTISKWMCQVMNMTANINASIQRMLNASIINASVVMKIVANETRAMATIRRMIMVIPLLKEYVSVVIELENASTILNNITKELPNNVPPNIASLIKKIRDTINESLKYLTQVVKAIESYKLKYCEKYLKSVKYLLKLVREFIEDLEQMIASQINVQISTTTSSMSLTYTSSYTHTRTSTMPRMP